MQCRVKRSAATVCAALLFCSSASALAGSATTQLRQTVDQLVLIIGDSALGSESRTHERREKLRKAISPRFDFLEMAMRSLGSYWQERSAVEKKEFVSLFTELLETAYVGTIESYRGEKVHYINEREEGKLATVNTRIVLGDRKSVSVNYRMRDVDGDWKVYDVIVDDISLVNNYRSQFSRVLARSSFAELLATMKDKKTGTTERRS